MLWGESGKDVNPRHQSLITHGQQVQMKEKQVVLRRSGLGCLHMGTLHSLTVPAMPT